MHIAYIELTSKLFMVKKCWKQWNQTKPKGRIECWPLPCNFSKCISLWMVCYFIQLIQFNCFYFMFSALLFSLIQCVRMILNDASSSFCDETRNWPRYSFFFLSFKWQKTLTTNCPDGAYNRNIYSQTTTLKKKPFIFYGI